MTPLWTWGGRFVGHQDGNDLWTYDGRHVGRFDGDVVYAPDGTYLGELRSDRLITHRGRTGQRAGSFSAWGRRGATVPYAIYVGLVMIAGYEDFPDL